MALTDKLSAIGDAIREKTGKEELIKLDDMPQEIGSIPTGNTDIEDGLVLRTLTYYRNDRITTITEQSFANWLVPLHLVFTNVTSIGRYTFFHGVKIRKVDFHKLNTIGGPFVFYDAYDLEALILRSPILCVLTNTDSFNGSGISNGTTYIYVPKALIEEYKVATNWVTYASQFRAIEDYPEICGGAE